MFEKHTFAKDSATYLMAVGSIVTVIAIVLLIVILANISSNNLAMALTGGALVYDLVLLTVGLMGVVIGAATKVLISIDKNLEAMAEAAVAGRDRAA